MLTSPVLAAVAIAAGVSWLAIHEATNKADQRAVKATQALTVVTVALVAFCAWSVAGNRPALVEADLEKGKSLEVPASDSAPVLLVHGELPHVASGQTAGGTFELEVREEGEVLDRYEGQMGETWRTGRAGRRGQTQSLVVKNEHRFDLPPEASAHALKVTLTKEDGDLKGPMHVAVMSPPPPRPIIIGIGVVLATAAAIADVLTGKKNRSSLWVALLAAFAAALLDGITPHSSPMSVIGAGLLALIFGLPAGILIRGLVGALPLGRPPETPAPAAG